MRAGLLAILLALPAYSAAPIPPQAILSPSVADADHFDAKLNAILQRGGARSGSPLRTTVTENEVNAYLVHRGRAQMAAGIVDPKIRILGGGRVTCQAVVDLDAVRESRPRSMFDPMRLVSGRLPVVATGVVHAKGGVGTIAVESVLVSGFQVPHVVLQELVSYYSKSSAYPDGIPLDSTFVLPAGIREIEVWTGQAVIIQ